MQDTRPMDPLAVWAQGRPSEQLRRPPLGHGRMPEVLVELTDLAGRCRYQSGDAGRLSGDAVFRYVETGGIVPPVSLPMSRPAQQVTLPAERGGLRAPWSEHETFDREGFDLTSSRGAVESHGRIMLLDALIRIGIIGIPRG